MNMQSTVGTFLWILGGYLAVVLPGNLLDLLFPEQWAGISAIPASMIFLWIAGMMRTRRCGVLHTDYGIVRAIRYLLPYLVFLVGDALLTGAGFCLTGTNVLAAVSAGVWEEIVFRGVPLAAFVSDAVYSGTETNGNGSMSRGAQVWGARGFWSLLLSAFLFGCFHLLNLFSGAGTALTVIQVLSAMAIGFFMGAVYLKTGSLTGLMLAHTLTDLLALATRSDLKGAVMTGNAVSFGEILSLFFSILMAGYGAWLLQAPQDPVHGSRGA